MREGLKKIDATPARVLTPRPVPSGDPNSLAEAAGDWRYWNHGILRTIGGLSTDPLADFAERADLGGDNFSGCGCLGVLFSGMGPDQPVFGRTFGMVRVEHWDALFDYFRSISGFDPSKRRYWSVTYQTWRMVDPTWYFDRGASLVAPRTIEVTTFGIDGTDGAYDFEPDGSHARKWGFPLKVRRRPPSPGVLATAKVLFADGHEPFRATEPTEHSPDVIAAAKSLVLPPGTG